MGIISVRSERRFRTIRARSRSWADVVQADGAPATLPDAAIDPTTTLHLYTSGTTGSRRAPTDTSRLGAQRDELMFMGMAGYREARVRAAAGGDAGAAPSAVPPQPVFMAPTPLFHVTACTACSTRPRSSRHDRAHA